jgi:hypothetical protein
MRIKKGSATSSKQVMSKKGSSKLCFQENSNLPKINHKLYILKEILVSNQYVPSTMYRYFDISDSLFAIK